MTPCWIHLSELRKDSDPLDYLKKYEAEISEAIEKEKEEDTWLKDYAEGEIYAKDKDRIVENRKCREIPGYYEKLITKERNDAMLDFSSAVARMGEAGVSREVAELFFRRKWRGK